jgi:hypothetical protein
MVMLSYRDLVGCLILDYFESSAYFFPTWISDRSHIPIHFTRIIHSIRRTGKTNNETSELHTCCDTAVMGNEYFCH